jgi:hypothetical protein
MVTFGPSTVTFGSSPRFGVTLFRSCRRAWRAQPRPSAQRERRGTAAQPFTLAPGITSYFFHFGNLQ